MGNLKQIQQSKQAVKHYWQNYGIHSLEGDAYKKRWKQEIYTPNWMAIVSACIEFGDLGGRKKVLEVGCGWGRIIVGIRKMLSEIQIHGVDLVEDLILHAEKVVGKETGDLDTQFSVGDALKLPYKTSYFDAVISTRVLQYVESPMNAVKEFARVVKPGGKVVVLLPNGLNPIRRYRYPAKLYTPSDIGEWFEYAGLQEIETRSVCFIPPWFQANHRSPLLFLESLRKVPGINQCGGMAAAIGRKQRQFIR